jgi:hypothetical protein
VFVDDKPFGPAMLSMSASDAAKKLPNSTGAVNAEGVAVLKSYPDSNGLVAGSYTCVLSPDPLKMNQVPMVTPMTAEFKDDAKTVDLHFKTVKNARPGMVPPSAQSGAPMSINLAPVK